jgi:vancomycin resistance protein YoaR
MTQIETETAPRSPRRRVISLGRAAGVGLACFPLLLFVFAFARFEAGNTALSGLTVAGVDVGGLSQAQIAARLEERARLLATQKVRLRVGAKEAGVSADELGLQLVARASSERAVALGRDGSFFGNAGRYLRSWWARQELPAQVHVDTPRLQAAFDGFDRSLIDDPPFPGGVVVEAGRAKAAPARSGRKIARGEAQAALARAFATGQVAAPISLATETQTPSLAAGELERAVTLAQTALAGRTSLVADTRRLEIEPAELGALISSRSEQGKLELGIDPVRLEAWLTSHRVGLEAAARDASFEVSARDEVKIVPGEPGVQLIAEDIAPALWRAAQRADRQAELPLRREPMPARTTERAEQLGIKQLVGSFTTRHPCCQKRVDNIHRIASLLDGLVVDPGQTVSVNAIVGPRTQKNGFVLAPGIEDGEMVDTVGGGVSQFATTFFNALFHAGYDIIERQPHSYWFPRYPMGHEATLSWPKPDIVFKNDSSAGLLVKTSFTGTTITVKLYGDVGGRRVTSSVSERREIVKPAVELLPNRDVAPDEEKVKDGGMIGWSVIAARTVTFADGTKKEEKRKVIYKPKARRVEVHPCRIPAGEPGATGEKCPEPVDAEQTSEGEGESESKAHSE